MRRPVSVIAFAVGIASAAAASGSTPAAWADLRVKSDRECLRAAVDMRNPRVTSYSPDFQVVTVSTIEGVSRARADRGARLVQTCVYDKRSGRAEVFELHRR